MFPVYALMTFLGLSFLIKFNEAILNGSMFEPTPRQSSQIFKNYHYLPSAKGGRLKTNMYPDVVLLEGVSLPICQWESEWMNSQTHLLPSTSHRTLAETHFGRRIEVRCQFHQDETASEGLRMNVTVIDPLKADEKFLPNLIPSERSEVMRRASCRSLSNSFLTNITSFICVWTHNLVFQNYVLRYSTEDSGKEHNFTAIQLEMFNAANKPQTRLISNLKKFESRETARDEPVNITDDKWEAVKEMDSRTHIFSYLSLVICYLSCLAVSFLIIRRLIPFMDNLKEDETQKKEVEKTEKDTPFGVSFESLMEEISELDAKEVGLEELQKLQFLCLLYGQAKQQSTEDNTKFPFPESSDRFHET